MVRKTWPGYTALYKDRRGNTITVKSLDPPPKTRKFKVSGGYRTYTRVKYKKYLQEVLIVARATKKPAKKSTGSSRRKKQEEVTVTDDEIDELESVDELEEDEDLDEDDDDDLDEEEDDDEEEDEDEEDDDEPEDEDDEEDEDEDDEEEEAPPKKSKKPRQSRAAADGMIGTNEIAERAGVDGRTLRMVLRKHNVEKDPETRRYQWKSWNNKTVKQILKWLAAGEADEVKKESLGKLKETQEAKRAAKEKKSSKGTSKKAAKKPAKKRRRSADDDED